MIRLALPGLVMVEAEWMAFEILTLSASWLGPIPLAAQSILINIATIMAQIALPLSITAASRVANLIGAGLPSHAMLAAKATLMGAILVGIFNTAVLMCFGNYIPLLFTDQNYPYDSSLATI